MVNLSQIKNKNNIKSIQRGILSFTTNVSTTNTTISPVDMSKSELRMLGYTLPGTASPGDFSLLMISSNTIQAYNAYPSGGYTVYMSWQIIERN